MLSLPLVTMVFPTARINRMNRRAGEGRGERRFYYHLDIYTYHHQLKSPSSLSFPFFLPYLYNMHVFLLFDHPISLSPLASPPKILVRQVRSPCRTVRSNTICVPLCNVKLCMCCVGFGSLWSSQDIYFINYFQVICQDWSFILSPLSSLTA